MSVMAFIRSLGGIDAEMDGLARPDMAALAPPGAVVGIGADEHPSALVVGDDFVEVAVGRSAQGAAMVPFLCTSKGWSSKSRLSTLVNGGTA